MVPTNDQKPIHVPLLEKEVYMSILVNRPDSVAWRNVRYGARLYKTSLFFWNFPITRWPPCLLTSQSANLWASPGFLALLPISRCAGFSNRSSSSSLPALYIVASCVICCARLSQVPQSVMVYSPNWIAAVRAWIGKATYWWYQVE